MLDLNATSTSIVAPVINGIGIKNVTLQKCHKTANGNYRKMYKQLSKKTMAQAWGQYPPEALICWVARTFKETKSALNLLEVGCGAGANLWCSRV